MTVIKTALLWLVFVLFVISVPYHLYKVSKGEYTYTEKPLANAIGAVANAILALLWWMFVING